MTRFLEHAIRRYGNIRLFYAPKSAAKIVYEPCIDKKEKKIFLIYKEIQNRLQSQIYLKPVCMD